MCHHFYVMCPMLMLECLLHRKNVTYLLAIYVDRAMENVENNNMD